MTSLSSAAGAGRGVAGRTRSAASSRTSSRRMGWSPFRLELQDGDTLSSDQRAEEEHRADDDREDDRAEGARDAREPVLHLVEDRHRAEVEPRVDEEDHRADGDHPVDEEIDEDRESRA